MSINFSNLSQFVKYTNQNKTTLPNISNERHGAPAGEGLLKNEPEIIPKGSTVVQEELNVNQLAEDDELLFAIQTNEHSHRSLTSLKHQIEQQAVNLKTEPSQVSYSDLNALARMPDSQNSARRQLQKITQCQSTKSLASMQLQLSERQQRSRNSSKQGDQSSSRGAVPRAFVPKQQPEYLDSNELLVSSENESASMKGQKFFNQVEFVRQNDAIWE